jgi:hypothetical protein
MITLHLASAGLDALSLSGAAMTGDHLFLAPDEGDGIIRLRRTGDADFADAAIIPLRDLVRLPGDRGDELDLEGLDVTANALWVVGSHGAVRKRARDDDAVDKIPRTLAKVDHPVSRTLLARIPAVAAADGPTLSATALPGSADGWIAAASLSVTAGRGELLRSLDNDEHLAPFLAVPSKDNGLDIEGLAVCGDRVLLGLRGPVLRGWAVILTLVPRPDPAAPGVMTLSKIGDGTRRYTKHFVNLDGLGVRDLARDGDDLLILAGPSMLLDGPSRVLRLPRGAVQPLAPAIPRASLQVLAELSVGVGADHPEAITPLRGAAAPQGLMVVYDSPSALHESDGNALVEVLPVL